MGRDVCGTETPVSHPSLRLAGMGRSGAGLGPFAHHEDLRALLETVGLDRASLVGISVGGKIAIDYALRYPDTVQSLVLVNPGVNGYRWSDEFLALEADLQRLWEQGLRDQALERFLQTWVDGPFRRNGEVHPSVRRRVRQLVADNWERARTHTPQFLSAIDRLSDISAPTLVIRGDQDWEEIQALAQFVAASIPRAELVTLTGTGHLPPLEQPDVFHAYLLRFLERHATG
ncbi:alpha/beta fold hydrolase [Calditerricola yamamurae]